MIAYFLSVERMRSLFAFRMVFAIICLLVCHAESVDGNRAESECNIDKCADSMLRNPDGPQLMKLFMELAKKDPPGTPTKPFNLGGKTFDLSKPKEKAAKNALAKGLPKDILNDFMTQTGIEESTEPSTSEGTSEVTSMEPPLTSESSEASSAITEESPTSPDLSTDSSTTESPDDSSVINEPPLPRKQSPPCNIVSTQDGDMILQYGNAQLPLSQIRNLEHALDPEKLKKLTELLKDVGVPLKHQNNRIYPVNPPAKSTPLSMRIRSLNGVPVEADVEITPNRYKLPYQQKQLNQRLAKEPSLGFPMMKLFAAHGMPAKLDCNRKSLSTILDDQGNEQQTTESPRTLQRKAPSDDVRRPNPETAKLPDEWTSIKDAIESNRVSASKIQRLIEEQDLTVPAPMKKLIFNKIMQMKDQVMSMFRDGDCLVYMNGSPLSLLSQPDDIVEMLKRNDIPTELIRNSLMTIGVSSESGPGDTLTMRLPSQRTCILENVPSMDIFDYGVRPDDNSVDVSVGPNTFRLPADASNLQSAMEKGSIIPYELMDSLNRNGIPCRIDADKGVMSMSLPDGNLRIPLETQKDKKTSKLRLVPLEGPLGTSYTLEYDGGRIHLPSQVEKLNQLIKSGKINSHDVLFLFLQNTLVPYNFDKQKHVHVLKIAGETINIATSSID